MFGVFELIASSLCLLMQEISKEPPGHPGLSFLKVDVEVDGLRCKVKVVECSEGVIK